MVVEFYSDSATFGKPTGFELIWEIKHTKNELVNLEFEYSTESTGSKDLSCSMLDKETAIKRIFVINTRKIKAVESSLILKTEGDFHSGEILIFPSERGNFTQGERYLVLFH